MLKVQEIRELIKLIDESSIAEFTYETNGTIVTMKKNVAQSAATASKQVILTTEQEEEKVPVVESEAPREEVETEKNANQDANYDYEIVSPMVGTFYRAPNPESDPYVTTGSIVDPSTVVCIVEAMKLFNEIEAEISGEIVEILVEDGELVEYGQPLFRVKTR